MTPISTQPMIITGHQPVYLPWLGLFHKIALADVFVFMDDVQYLEKDWNNRNRIKTPHGPLWLTVPVSLKKSPSMILKDIVIDSSKYGTKDDWQLNHWKSIEMNYKKAPHFKEYADFFHQMYTQTRWEKLSDVCEHQLKHLIKIFDLPIKMVKASEQNFTQKKSDLVLEHCTRFNAQICVTGFHGRDYIQEKDFEAKGVKVYFQEYQHPQYPQLWGDFVPHLTVLDLLFNSGAESSSILRRGNISKEELIQLLGGVS